MLGHPFEQFARIKEAIKRRQRAHFGLRDAAQDVLGPQLAWMLQPSRAQQVAQRLDGVLVELEHARGLVPGVELAPALRVLGGDRSEEHTSELQSLMRISYAVFCLKKKKTDKR